MPIALEGAVPPPHLHLNTASPWSPYNSHYYPPTSSPGPMTPESISSYAPRLHDSPSQEGGVPSSGWFAPSVPAPSTQSEGPYNSYTYNHTYVNSHPSATHFSPHQRLPQVPEVPVVPTSSSIEHPAGNYSPVSQCSRGSEGPRQDFIAHSSAPSPVATTHISAPIRPRSSPAGEYAPWTMNPLGIHAGANMQHSHQQHHQTHYYPGSAYPPMRSPLLSETGVELNVDLAQRRMYAPIAPQPRVPGTSAPTKRSHDDSEEQTELSKRRKRSDSTTSTTIELGEEDKLLLRLKDEESMPWKDIAARFQTDLGKTYQIPALQMRLKRLRERMRVWTETDVKALRMAHEYWVQNKFDIISQKMLEFGAAEKWTARQCARKWTEVDTAGPTPYSYEYHNAYAPVQVSPIEAHHYMPYVHIQ